ncbi:hypothetical protein CEP52_009376 [Fusarium oligoseptatum]|uniref:Uncharacterized protein n=1 Tax=Fusarium oligoseptatum TaxID=2604345 RepID=A0A428TDC9_9HYPO|nr:hypothetical protein CEP52_009376 [Fusarium oligoseptatum]
MDAATMSQRPTLTYKGVHALLLHWQDGSESMYKELSRLRDVLGDTYCYDVKEWQIPLSKNSSDSVDSERVNWTALQVVLTSGTESDVLIIADCCHSGSPGYPSEIRAYGVVELLAACGFESVAPMDGEHCFTHNLVEQLKKDHGMDCKTSLFYTELLCRLTEYAPSGIEQRAGEL